MNGQDLPSRMPRHPECAEAGNPQIDDVDGDQWTIPAERMKGRLIQKQSAADHSAARGEFCTGAATLFLNRLNSARKLRSSSCFGG